MSLLLIAIKYTDSFSSITFFVALMGSICRITRASTFDEPVYAIHYTVGAAHPNQPNEENSKNYLGGRM